MKKRIKYLVLVLLLFFAFIKVNALEVSKNNLTIKKGGHEKVELYVNTENAITKVDFTLVFSTYDIPASFEIADGLTDSNPNGIKHNITLIEPQTGKILLGTVSISVKNNAPTMNGTVSIHTAYAKTESGETINLKAQTINIDVPGEEQPKEVDKSLIDKIESKLVDIELKKDVFEYTVTIKENIEELDLKAIPKDSNTKIEIGTQQISELTDNIITITAKNNDIEQKYLIKIETEKEEKRTAETIVDKDKFKKDNSYKIKWIILIVPLLMVFLSGMLISKKK